MIAAPDRIAVAAKYDDCHEEVTRRGHRQPCEKPATAVRYDGQDGAYPVCAFHSREPMVPLTAMRAALATPPDMT